VIARVTIVSAVAAFFAADAGTQLSSFDDAQCKKLEALTRQLRGVLPNSNEASPVVVDLRRRIDPIRADLSIAHPGKSAEEICAGLATLRPPQLPSAPGVAAQAQ
jgi:hypothetical protein